MAQCTIDCTGRARSRAHAACAYWPVCPSKMTWSSSATTRARTHLSAFRRCYCCCWPSSRCVRKTNPETTQQRECIVVTSDAVSDNNSTTRALSEIEVHIDRRPFAAAAAIVVDAHDFGGYHDLGHQSLHDLTLALKVIVARDLVDVVLDLVQQGRGRADGTFLLLGEFALVAHAVELETQRRGLGTDRVQVLLQFIERAQSATRHLARTLAFSVLGGECPTQFRLALGTPGNRAEAPSQFGLCEGQRLLRVGSELLDLRPDVVLERQRVHHLADATIAGFGVHRADLGVTAVVAIRSVHRPTTVLIGMCIPATAIAATNQTAEQVGLFGVALAKDPVALHVAVRQIPRRVIHQRRHLARDRAGLRVVHVRAPVRRIHDHLTDLRGKPGFASVDNGPVAVAPRGRDVQGVEAPRFVDGRGTLVGEAMKDASRKFCLSETRTLCDPIAGHEQAARLGGHVAKGDWSTRPARGAHLAITAFGHFLQDRGAMQARAAGVDVADELALRTAIELLGERQQCAVQRRQRAHGTGVDPDVAAGDATHARDDEHRILVGERAHGLDQLQSSRPILEQQRAAGRIVPELAGDPNLTLSLPLPQIMLLRLNGAVFGLVFGTHPTVEEMGAFYTLHCRSGPPFQSFLICGPRVSMQLTRGISLVWPGTDGNRRGWHAERVGNSAESARTDG